MPRQRPPGRTLFAVLCTACGLALACGWGDTVPEPWSRREGNHTVVTGSSGPGGSSGDRSGTGAAPVVGPTTTTRATAQPPADLPPVALAYPEVVKTGRIEACPAGTELSGDERAGEQFCVLVGTDTRHGPSVRLYGNGKVHEAGPYRGGQRHGDWSEFHRSGKLAGTWRWTDGQPGGRVDL